MKKMRSVIFLYLACLTHTVSAQNIWEPTKGPHELAVYEAIVTSDERLFISTLEGIFTSKDQGQNWEQIKKGLDSKSSFARSMSAGPNGTVFAISNQKLYRLDKDFEEWVQIKDYECCNIKVIANDFGGVYLRNLDNKTIQYSADSGISFQYILNNMANSLLATELKGNDNNFLLVDENSSYSIFRMNDDGSGLLKILDQVKDASYLLWHSAGYLFLVTRDQKLFRVDRDGKNLIDVSPLNSNMKKFVINPNGNLRAFTDSADLESSDFGMNWFVAGSIIYKKVFADSKLLQSQNDVYLFHPYKQCLDNGLYKTANGGNDWTGFEEFFKPQFVNQIVSSKQNLLFAEECGYGKYSFSQDKGMHWQPFDLQMDAAGPSSNLVSCSSGELFIRVNGKVIKSTNAGLNWEELMINRQSHAYGLFGNFNSSVYVMGDFGNYLSRDCGLNWNEVPSSINFANTGIFNPDGSIFTMVKDHLNDIIRPKINYTNDDGLHWNTLNLQVAEIYEFAISRKGNIYFTAAEYSSGPVWLYLSKDKLLSYNKVKPVVRYDVLITGDDETVYIASGPTCEKSIDEGIHWLPFDSGLPFEDQHQSTSFAFDQDNYLYLSFNGDVVYKTTKPTSLPVSTQDELGQVHISIDHNEDKLIIKLHTVAKKFDCGWAFADVTGHCIQKGKLKSNQFSIGIHELPNGIYFLKFGDPRLPIQKIVIQH